jgi:hypothetical protein
MFPKHEVARHNWLCDWLIAEQNLLELVLADLVHYKTEAYAYYQQNPNACYDWNLFVFAGQKIAHIYQVQQRLTFLQVALAQLPIQIQPAHLETVWKCLVSTSITKEESDACFHWFQGLLSSHENPLPDALAMQIFEQQILAIPLDKYTLNAFHLVCQQASACTMRD